MDKNGRCVRISDICHPLRTVTPLDRRIHQGHSSPPMGVEHRRFLLPPAVRSPPELQWNRLLLYGLSDVAAAVAIGNSLNCNALWLPPTEFVARTRCNHEVPSNSALYESGLLFLRWSGGGLTIA